MMNYRDLAIKSVETQPVYEPGRPVETVARELGLDPEGIIKMASNENPFGPSPKACKAVKDMLSQSHRYPDGGCFFLKEKLAVNLDLAPGQIVPGNGSNEIIELLGHVFLETGDEVVMGTPAFIVYKLVTVLFGAIPVEVPLVNHRHNLSAMLDGITERTKMVFLPSPNNPTGTANSEEEVLDFVRSLPDHVIFVFDEAYAEYLDNPPDLRPLIREGRKVVCLRTFSKIYGLASMRIGYGYGSEDWAKWINRVRQPFNVNALAQSAALAALDDVDFVHHCRTENRRGLKQLEKGLEALGIEPVPSEANFLMVRVGDGGSAFQRLQATGIIVRPLAPYNLGEYIRVSVGSAAENDRFLEAMKDLMEKGELGDL